MCMHIIYVGCKAALALEKEMVRQLRININMGSSLVPVVSRRQVGKHQNNEDAIRDGIIKARDADVKWGTINPMANHNPSECVAASRKAHASPIYQTLYPREGIFTRL